MTPVESNPPAAPPVGSASTVAQTDSEGWVTARPPRMLEVLQRLVCFPLLLVRQRDLVSTSVKRELESRFQGTVLGWLWPLFHPLFLFTVYYFIFAKLLNFKFPDLPEGQEAAMGVFMFVGVTVWAALAETLNRGTNAIVDNGNLIKKLAFPSELLPLNLTVVGIVTLLFAVVAFIAVCVATPVWAAPGWALLWIPVLLFVQCVFTFGLTLFLSTLQVFLRDTVQVIAIGTTVWMFVTPIFWTPQIVSSDALEAFTPYLELNPVFHLVQAWRGVLMGDLYVTPTADIGGGFVVSVDAIARHVGIFSIWAVAVYVIGFAFFVLCQRRFADEV